MEATPDLVAALEAVVEEAARTQDRLDNGEAVKGTSGLWRIRHIAGDALADARGEDRESAAA